MRIVFCGSPVEAATALRAVHAAGHEIALAVTRPDRPRGRGRVLAAPPVKETALELGLPVFQPDDAGGGAGVNEPANVEVIRATRPELLVVVAFGAILREPLLQLARRGAVNVHFSLLPAYRGACPVEWALIDGRTETGVTTMFMAAKVDAGDIILVRRVGIGVDETAGELRRRLAVAGAELLVETLHVLGSGGPVPRATQDPLLRSKAPRIKDEMARIDWSRNAVAIHNLVRALNPEPGAVALAGGETIKIWRSRVRAAGGRDGRPGEILSLGPDGPVVACGEGSLVLIELQAPGRRALPGAEFARGRRLLPGGIFERAPAP